MFPGSIPTAFMLHLKRDVVVGRGKIASRGPAAAAARGSAGALEDREPVDVDVGEPPVRTAVLALGLLGAQLALDVDRVALLGVLGHDLRRLAPGRAVDPLRVLDLLAVFVLVVLV